MCPKCSREVRLDAAYCDKCGELLPPLPPVPSPQTTAREVSRLYISIGLLIVTAVTIGLAAAYPNALAFWQFIIGSLLATTASTVNYYFGNKASADSFARQRG